MEIFRRINAAPEWVAIDAVLIGTDRTLLRVSEFPGMANYALEDTSSYVSLGGRPFIFSVGKDTVAGMVHEMKATLRSLYGSPERRPSLESM